MSREQPHMKGQRLKSKNNQYVFMIQLSTRRSPVSCDEVGFVFEMVRFSERCILLVCNFFEGMLFWKWSFKVFSKLTATASRTPRNYYFSKNYQWLSVLAKCISASQKPKSDFRRKMLFRKNVTVQLANDWHIWVLLNITNRCWFKWRQNVFTFSHYTMKLKKKSV